MYHQYLILVTKSPVSSHRFFRGTKELNKYFIKCGESWYINRENYTTNINGIVELKNGGKTNLKIKNELSEIDILNGVEFYCEFFIYYQGPARRYHDYQRRWDIWAQYYDMLTFQITKKNGEWFSQLNPNSLSNTYRMITCNDVPGYSYAEEEKKVAKLLDKFEKEEEKLLVPHNKAEEEAFLKENAKKPGVKVTASGLQYKVIIEGSGPLPKEMDAVKIHYRITLIDNTQFDSTYKRNKPTVWPVKYWSKGLTEALQLMKVGSKWQIFLPSNLAFGESGKFGDKQVIGSNAALIIAVELLDIKPNLIAGTSKVTIATIPEKNEEALQTKTLNLPSSEPAKKYTEANLISALKNVNYIITGGKNYTIRWITVPNATDRRRILEYIKNAKEALNSAAEIAKNLSNEEVLSIIVQCEGALDRDLNDFNSGGGGKSGLSDARRIIKEYLKGK